MNEFLDWINEDAEKEISEFTEKLGKFSPAHRRYLRDIKYALGYFGKKESSSHKTYGHGFAYLINRAKIVKSVEKGLFKAGNSEDLKTIHRMLFGSGEGQYSGFTNDISMELDNGTKKKFYISAPAQEKEAEVQKAFECYKDAVSERPELAPVFEICLYQKLLRVHPFEDGNGRTLRLMLQIRLYALGYKDIFKLSLDYLVKNFRSGYLAHSDIHILYARLGRVIKYEDPVLYGEFVPFMMNLIIVGMKDIY